MGRKSQCWYSSSEAKLNFSSYHMYMSVFFLPTALGQHDSDLQSCHFGTEFIPTLQIAFQKKVTAVVAVMADKYY